MNENMNRAIDLVLAMMRSASTNKIQPKRWWERARTALETAAATAGDFPEMVAVMGRKLEIDVTRNETADVIARLTPELAMFEPFRRLCETQALYVVALAQSRREEQREEIAAKVDAKKQRDIQTDLKIDEVLG